MLRWHQQATPNHALKIAIQAWCSRPVASPGESGGKEEPSSDHEQNDEPDGSPNNAGYKKNKKKKKKKKASGPVQLSYEEFKKTLLCPITKTFMEDPVVWADGFSYERKAIEASDRGAIIEWTYGVNKIRAKDAAQKLGAEHTVAPGNSSLA